MRSRVLLGSCSFVALAIAGVAGAQSSTESYRYDALGRLIEAKTEDGQNNDETHSICYDASGNRIRYLSTADGSSANCPTGTPAPTPSPTPTPTPTPTPGNSPPVTVNDTTSGACSTTKTVNLTANDSDPEANYPLTLVSISHVSGALSYASVVSASSVSVEFASDAGTAIFSYTVKDSLNASSPGMLTATSSGAGCGA